MLLKELSQPRYSVKKLNETLQKSYGRRVPANIDIDRLKELLEQVNNDLRTLVVEGVTPQDPEYARRLIIKNAAEKILEQRQKIQEATLANGVLDKICGKLISFVCNCINDGDDPDHAINKAMDVYRSSKYRFPDSEVENKVRHGVDHAFGMSPSYSYDRDTLFDERDVQHVDATTSMAKKKLKHFIEQNLPAGASVTYNVDFGHSPNILSGKVRFITQDANDQRKVEKVFKAIQQTAELEDFEVSTTPTNISFFILLRTSVKERNKFLGARDEFEVHGEKYPVEEDSDEEIAKDPERSYAHAKRILGTRNKEDEPDGAKTIKVSFHSRAAKNKWMKKQSVSPKEVISQTPTMVELSSYMKMYAQKEDHDEIYQVEESVQLDEAFPLLVPALATAVRLGAPAVTRLLSKNGAKQVAKKVAQNTGKAAAVTGKTVVKNPGKSLAAYGAYKVWDTVSEVAEWLEDVGLDKDLIPAVAKVVVRYGIPTIAVLAALYGGKKLYDYVKDNNDPEEEEILAALENEYGTANEGLIGAAGGALVGGAALGPVGAIGGAMLGHALTDDVDMYEDTPPGMEDWVLDNKKEFKKRYGSRWEEVLYATAWKIHNQENGDNK